MAEIMNKKEIEGFLNIVKKDEKLQKLVNELDTKLENTSDAESLVKKELLPVAAEKGFNFTAKDFLTYLKETTNKLEKDAVKKVSGDGTVVPSKSSKFGGGKIGKLLLLLGGGAAVGTSGAFAVRHFKNAQKAKTAQVQTLNKNENLETTNDGLRPELEGEQAQEEKTSDQLKEALKGKQSNSGNDATAPSANNVTKPSKPNGGAKNNATTPSAQQMPQLSGEQVKEIDQKLDDLLNNKDGQLDQIYNQAKAMDPSIKKEDLVKIYREMRNAKPEEKMQMLMESMQAMQQMAGGAGQAKK